MLQNLETHQSCFCYNNKEDQTVKSEAFPHEEATPVHLPLFVHTILFITKGTVQVMLENDDREWKLNKGEFIFIPAGVRLSRMASADSAMLTVRLTEEVPECHVFNINKIAKYIEKKHDGIYALELKGRMRYFVDGLLATQKDGLKCRIYMQLKISEMLFLLHAYYPQEECIKFFSSIISPDIGFSEFVRLNHTQYPTVTELAGALNMSAQQFSSRFRKVFGKTPREWMQQQKAQNIYRDICKSGKPLKNIASEYNFSDQPNFIRYCHHHFGSSPGAIRKKLQVH